MGSLDFGWFEGQVRQYRAVRPVYQRFAASLLSVLEGAVRGLETPAIVQVRAKEVPSFAEKILRKRSKYVEPVHQFNDLCGGRVITSTSEQVAAVAAFIRSHFEIDEGTSEDVLDRLRPEEFGYGSIHFTVSFRPGVFPEIDDAEKGRGDQSLFARYPEGKANLRGPRFRAEVQVRTLLQHAWAEVMHDSLYKGGFSVPRRWQRDAARVAAMLEEADDLLVRVTNGVRTYRTHFGAYMDRERIEQEIQVLETVLRHDPDNAALAGRTARLHMSLDRWEDAARLLAPFAGSKRPEVQHDLGVAHWRAGRREGRAHLERAVELFPAYSDALCELAESWSAEDPEKERALYRRAFDANPSQPRALRGYVQSRICYDHDLDFIPLIRPSLEAAIARCQEWAASEVNLPQALFDAGLFGLLLCSAEKPPALGETGAPRSLRGFEALDAYCRAIRLSQTDEPIRGALASISALGRALGDKLPELEWVQRLLRLGIVAKHQAFVAEAVERRVRAQEKTHRLEIINPVPSDELAKSREVLAGAQRDEATARAAAVKAPEEHLHRLATPGVAPLRPPLIIVAGGCDASIAQRMAEYTLLVHAAFAGFSGTIISAGTTAGIGGIVGDLPAAGAAAPRRIAYLPQYLPLGDTPHPAYEHRQTRGVGYSPLEPLQNWIDLLVDGIPAAEVKLLGINGGPIAAFEYRLALALGAQVAVLADSGREATRIAEGPAWVRSASVAGLPSDGETLRAFVQRGSTSCFDEPTRDSLARAAHEKYRADQKGRFTKLDPAMAEWDDLVESLRESNRCQVDDIERKLRAIGLALRRVEGRPVKAWSFRPEQIEILAEMEHGRWNAERARDGWRPGPRDVEAKTTPYLVPWSELPEEVKRWDRQAVEKVPEQVAKVGYEIFEP